MDRELRLIFSRDRAAQLDLLLRSLHEHAPPVKTAAIVRWSDDRHADGYDDLFKDPEHGDVAFFSESYNEGFQKLLTGLISQFTEVTFFCDDDVVFKPLPYLPVLDERSLTFSWRLSAAEPWEWMPLPRTDHGYPGSIDGHLFRTSDVQRMIEGQDIPNPTMLETILAHRCTALAEERPLMQAFPEQVLVGVPVNRVSEQSGCPTGELHPQTAADLNARWLAGERIALDSVVSASECHVEVPFSWQPR